MLKPSKLFSESELKHIEQAVKDAESLTSGEIVPYVVEMSDTYEVSEWRAGGLVGVLVLATIAVLQGFTNVWWSFSIVEIAIVVAFSSAAGALLTHVVPRLQRSFAGKRVMDLRVYQRAAQAFVEEEVFATKERTGILIFLSLFERRVLVLADSGINAKVKQSDWDEIVQLITSSIREGKPTEGLIAAINKCGILLAHQGVERRANDMDELPDTLRIGDR